MTSSPQAQDDLGTPQPKRRKTGLIITIAIAAVVVVAGGVTAFVLLRGDDTAQAQSGPDVGSDGSGADIADLNELGDKFSDGVMRADKDLVMEVTCDPTTVTDPGPPPPGAGLARSGDATVTGETAVVTFKLTDDGKTSEQRLDAKRDAGKWCLVGPQR